MGDTIFGSIFRVLIYSILMMFLVISMLFFYNISTMNNFISQSNAVVARSGGLTKSAYDEINNISLDHFHGMYHASVRGGTQAPQRQVTSYHGKYSSLFDRNRDNGFNDSESDNYAKSQANYGKQVHYYVYADVPYDPPFMQRMAIHTGVHGHIATGSSVRESVGSGVRPGTQN